jgi:hypothetical protein
MPADIDALLKRYARDFPEQVNDVQADRAARPRR